MEKFIIQKFYLKIIWIKNKNIIYNSENNLNFLNLGLPNNVKYYLSYKLNLFSWCKN